MKKQNVNSTTAAILRQKAEELLKLRTDAQPCVSTNENDVRKLLHELQVHQIELEMQNEELIIAKEKIEQLAKEKYKELYDFAPSGYLSLTKDGDIIELNFAAAKMLSKARSHLIKSRFAFFITEDTRSVFNRFFDAIFTSKIKQSCEVSIANEDNLPICVTIEGVISQNDKYCFLTLIDITKRKQAEIALQHFKHIVSNTTDIMALIDKNYIYLAVNKEYTINFNKTEEAFIGASVEAIFGKSFFEKVIKPNGDRCLKGEITNYQNWFDFPNKESVYMDVFYHPYYNEANEIIGFSVNARNITKQYFADEALKKSEENLRLSTELANVAVWEYNFNTDSMSRSNNHDLLYGLPPQERWKMDTFLNATHPLDREISSGFIQKSVASGGPDNYSFDFRVVYPNKTIHWLNVIGQVMVRNSKGEGVIVRGTLMDITERKNLTEAIKRNERVLQLFVKHSPAAIAMFDKEMKYIVVSDRFKLDYRLGEKVLTGRSHYEIFPEMTAEYKEIHQRCLAGEIIKNEEASFLRADGTLDWVRWEIHPWYEQPDKIGGIILFSEVITERKQAEEALKENYALLRIAGKTAKFGGWNVNLNENRTYWSDQVAAIHEMPAGYTPLVEEAILFYAPECRNKIKEVFANCAQNGISYDEDMEIITSKGNRVWVRTIGEAVRDNKGEIVKVQGSFQDITERKLAEENLRLSNQTIKNILDFSSAVIYIFDLKGEFLLANKNFEKILGVTQEELLGQTREKYFPKEVAQQHRNNDLQVINSKKPLFFEEENREADGNHFYWTSKFPLFDAKGEIYAVGGISADITDRKNAEEEIYNANRELQMLNNTILTLISGSDLDKTLNKILQTALEVIGLEGGTICLINPDNTFNLVVERGVSKEILDDFTNNKVKIGDCLCGNCAINCQPLILNTKDEVLKYASREAHLGDDIHFHAAFPFVIDKKSIGVLCVFTRTDTKPSLKNLKLLETIVSQTSIFIDNMLLYKEIDHQNTNLEKIVAQRTQQLEYTNSELRDFAQVVSHDLKAPLRAISQLSYWLYKDYADKIDQAGQNQLSLIISRTKRLDDLIDGILQYSKAGKQLIKQQEIDLNALVKRCIKELNLPEHIQIRIDNKLPFYTADETRMVQLFQNLIDNAIKYNDKPKGKIHIGCKTKDGFYEFYISDNGIGIEENYFERIFQIFQRIESRDYQEGTGIGLSLVKRIVQIYGGEVKLTSKVGKGSKFYFTLPIINNIT